jgi:hypothetical protein
MRLTALTVIAALGLFATAVSARAAPLVPDLSPRHSPNIVQVWGGCGPGGRPVPGHWSQWRGWVPRHCAPGYRPYGPYAGGWHRYGYRYW